MLRAAIEGIKARGGADLGEKTLLDALAPMTDTIERELGAGTAPADIAKAAAVTAREAAEATRPMQARRGRASYTGRAQHRLARPGRGRGRRAGRARRRHLVTPTRPRSGGDAATGLDNTTMWRND